MSSPSECSLRPRSPAHKSQLRAANLALVLACVPKAVGCGVEDSGTWEQEERVWGQLSRMAGQWWRCGLHAARWEQLPFDLHLWGSINHLHFCPMIY